MATVHLTDDAKEDLRDLDGSAKKQVFKALIKLEDQPDLRGQPLGSKKSGNLTGLRKLVVGDRDYRIVYRVEDNGDVCVVWVIGRRADDEVYEIAMARLKMRSEIPMRDEIANIVALAFKST